MDREMGKISPIATRLRTAREQSGLSQGQVAKMLGLHRPTISEMEAGRRRVTAEELARLAEIYGVSVAWLVNAEDADVNQARIELAARNLAKLKAEDLDRVLNLLAALRSEGDEPEGGTPRE